LSSPIERVGVIWCKEAKPIGVEEGYAARRLFLGAATTLFGIRSFLA